jgi:hypothetical protein
MPGLMASLQDRTTQMACRLSRFAGRQRDMLEANRLRCDRRQRRVRCDATGASAAFREQAHCRRTGWLAKLARRPRCQNFIFHTG